MIPAALRTLVVGWAVLAVPLPLIAQTPLTPDELLVSVDRALPLLEQARQELALARGAVVEALGAFDLTAKVTAKSMRGYYDNDRVTALLEQSLAPLGLNVYAGYRIGRGDFAPYDSRSQTLSEGEATAGAVLPLLRNRAVDSRRAGQQVAELGVGVAERGVDKARLTVYRDALSEYWEWVAAGQQLRIARALLELAEARDAQLRDAVALGQVAPVERTDNLRAILQRRSALAQAERQLQLKAIDISLYLRGPDGAPIRPGPERLPPLASPAPSAAPDEAVEAMVALERRPELAALRLKRAQQTVEVRLAENTILPSLDLFSEVSRDRGHGPASQSGGGVEAGISFQLPLQRRRGVGKTAQARAKLSSLDRELQWTEDNVRADVQDAISALRAARTIVDVLTEEVRVARELEALERDRFALGDSTQFLVNLRELATADAALREAKALADYQKALVSVEGATGRLLARAPTP